MLTVKSIRCPVPNSPTEHEKARRELDKIFPDNLSQSWGEAMIPALKATVMSWHLRHAPQPPTRETIEKYFLTRQGWIWQEEGRKVTLNPTFITELMALFHSASLSPAKPERWWCSHTSLKDERIEVLCDHGEQGHSEEICSRWQFCPICGKERPRPQDNPQEDGNGQ